MKTFTTDEILNKILEFHENHKNSFFYNFCYNLLKIILTLIFLAVLLIIFVNFPKTLYIVSFVLLVYFYIWITFDKT